MRVFVLRARRAPVSADRFLAQVGGAAHVEIIAHTLQNALFLSKTHYPEVVVHVVLESSRDFSRTVTVDSEKLGDTGGFHEAALLRLVADALERGEKLGKEERVAVTAGVDVCAISFERLVARLAKDHPLYLLDRKGSDVRETSLAPDPCFILTDHVPMQNKSLGTLRRLGAQSISLGPRMLFASQCVVLLHNELDRRAM